MPNPLLCDFLFPDIALIIVYIHISGLLQPELYTTFLASIMFFHSIAKAQHREQGKHLSTIIGGIYLLSLQLDSIYTTQRDNTVR